MKRSIVGIFVAVLLIGTACENNSDDYGTLKLKITDSPFPIELIDEASVTITKIEIRSVSDSSDKFTLISDDTLTFNLLELRNGISADLAEVELPAGTYDQVRLYVDSASLSIIDGATYDLKVPSGSSSGIKLNISPALTITGSLTSELLLDFSLEKSFVLKGNTYTPAGIKGFNFKPVVRVSNMSTSGTVRGSVLDTSNVFLENAEVWISADTVISAAFTDSVGYYAFTGMPAGIYTLTATKDSYDTVIVENVSVVAANLTEEDLILTFVE